MSPVSLQELRAALTARDAGQVYVVMRGSKAFDPIEQVARRVADLYQMTDGRWDFTDKGREIGAASIDSICGEQTLMALAGYLFGDAP